MTFEWLVGQSSRLPFALLISLRSQLADRFIGFGLITMAVAGSVALTISVEIASRALQEGLQATEQALTGSADLVISSGDTGVPEDALVEVRELPGVSAASPLIRRTLRLASGAAVGRPLHVLGLDLLAENDTRIFELSHSQLAAQDALRLLALPDSIVVSRRLAIELELVEGAPLAFTFGGRRIELIVRGILDGQLAEAYGGQIAGMDIYALQSILGIDGSFDQIDVAAEAGVSIDDLSARIAAALGPDLSIRRDMERESFGLALLRTYQRALWSFVLIALATSALLTYAASSMSVDRRLEELSLLRMAGMEGSRVGRAVLVDSLVVAVGGTVLGALAAPFLSRAVVEVLAVGASVRSGATLGAPRFAPMTFVFATLVGVVAVAAAALPSARRAARVRPLDLVDLGRGRARLDLTRTRALIVGVLGLALLASATIDAAATTGIGVAVGLIGGVACAAGLGQRLVDRSGGPVEWLTRAAPRIGLLIGPFLRDRPLQTSLTLAAWATIVAGLIAGVTTIRSYTNGVDSYYYGLYGEDAVMVVVGDPLGGGGREALTPSSLSALRADPHVEQISALRGVDVAYGGTQVPVYSFPTEALARRGDLRFATNAPNELRAALTRGELAMNDRFAKRFDVRVGDSIALPTSQAARTFRVGALIRAGIGPAGSLHLDDASFDRAFSTLDTSSAHAAALWLAPPAGESIRALRAMPTPQALFFLQGAEARRLVAQSAEKYRALLAAPVALICGLGLVSLVSLLFSSTRARQNEFLLLRAAGATRFNLVMVVALGGGVIGAFGAVIGAVIGGVWSIVTCATLSEALGWSVTPLVSANLVSGVVAAAALLATLASLLPALLSSRSPHEVAPTPR